MSARNRDGEHRPRILLVDDTELNRDLIGSILKAADFDVDFACDGEAAYEATWGKTYDLVLMDVEMPRMNGFETAARIRAREGVMSGVTIAALTATSGSNAEYFSCCSGIDEFIRRPIGPQALVERICEIIAKRHGTPNDWKPVWHFGDFAKFAERLDHDETDAYLEDLVALLRRVISSIDAATSGSEDFFYDVHKLFELSTDHGFEEIAGVCRFYKGDASTGARNRDPNFLGAANRALFAIASYRRDEDTSILSTLWMRTRTNVENLLRGRDQRAA